MLQIEEERTQIIDMHTRRITRNIDEAIVSNAFTIINVMGVKRETEGEEALIQDILAHLNGSMEGLSAAKATFSKSAQLLGALMRGEQPFLADPGDGPGAR